MQMHGEWLVLNQEDICIFHYNGWVVEIDPKECNFNTEAYPIGSTDIDDLISIRCGDQWPPVENLDEAIKYAIEHLWQRPEWTDDDIDKYLEKKKHRKETFGDEMTTVYPLFFNKPKAKKKYPKSRGSLHYAWSRLVKNRDKKCVKCGSKDDLHAHHIIDFVSDETKRYELDNGETLCGKCHKRHHKINGVKRKK